MTSKVTQADLMKVVDCIRAMADLVNASGPMGMPSGHLYALAMGKMSLETYQKIVALMVEAGSIRQQGHLLLPGVRK
jgi:hypothetical protein